MWRRVYLLLVLVRLWFALSPSYLHPDENFQGPEVIAGKESFDFSVSPLSVQAFCMFSISRLWVACFFSGCEESSLPKLHLGDAAARAATASRSCFPLSCKPPRPRQLHTNFPPGQIFSYPVRHTWEFTSDNPIRSVFPLWPVYGLPMLLLQWLWIGNGQSGEMPPIAVFWTLRVLMFVISFVLEDWAIHELIQSPRHRRVAVLLVASSYVTWTYQTHTFSNSIETLIVAWSMVLIQRIVDAPVSGSVLGPRASRLG